MGPDVSPFWSGGPRPGKAPGLNLPAPRAPGAVPADRAPGGGGPAPKAPGSADPKPRAPGSVRPKTSINESDR